MKAGVRRAIVTDDRYFLLNGQREGLPAVIVIDRDAFGREIRQSHTWHLSVIIDCVDLAEQGMPTPGESLILDREGDRIEGLVLGTGGGTFMARITWNKTRKLLFRVSDPKVVSESLNRYISSKENERPWDFQMWNDPECNEAQWFSNAVQAG